MDSYHPFYLSINTNLDGYMRAILEAQYKALHNSYFGAFLRRMEVYRPTGACIIHSSLDINSDCWHRPSENSLQMHASWVFLTQEKLSIRSSCKLYVDDMLKDASEDEIRELQDEPEARRQAIKKLQVDLKAIMRRARDPGHVLHLIPTLGVLVKPDLKPVRPREPYLPALSEESLRTLTTLVLNQ